MRKESFEIMPEKNPSSEIDPSLPNFRFTETEKEEMRKKGMTDEQIAERERMVNLRIARQSLAKEFKALRKDREP
jgi:hypothetical protein